MAEKFLRIGELAQLVGVSPKTIRHYHDVGVLPEPQRSASNYRLYNRQHLRRLRIIRDLRRLDLSLPAIRTIFDQQDSETALRAVLEDTQTEITEKIDALQKRRTEIEALLSQRKLDVDDTDHTSPTFLDIAPDELLALVPNDLDPALIKQEMRLQRLLSRYQWGNEPHATAENMFAALLENREAYKRLADDINSTLALLIHTPLEDKVIDRMAAEFVERHGELLTIWTEQPTSELPHSALLEEMMWDEVVPPIRRFLMTMRLLVTSSKASVSAAQ